MGRKELKSLRITKYVACISLVLIYLTYTYIAVSSQPWVMAHWPLAYRTVTVSPYNCVSKCVIYNYLETVQETEIDVP